MPLLAPLAGLFAAAVLATAGSTKNEATTRQLMVISAVSAASAAAAAAAAREGAERKAEKVAEEYEELLRKAREETYSEAKEAEHLARIAELERRLAAADPVLQNDYLMVPDNRKGWSYRRIFGKYLIGCSDILIQDPYIHSFHQIRNLVELLCMVNELMRPGGKVTIRLLTGVNSNAPEKYKEQMENLGRVKDSFAETATPFNFKVHPSPNFHTRSITTDHGWKIILDRGLDIFQRFERSPFNAATNLQEARLTKRCGVNIFQIN